MSIGSFVPKLIGRAKFHFLRRAPSYRYVGRP